MSEMYAKAFDIVQDMAELHPLEYWPSQDGRDQNMCSFCDVWCYIDVVLVHKDSCVWLRSRNIMDYE